MPPQASLHLRSSPVQSPSFDLAIVFVIILAAVFATLFAVIGSTWYLRSKRKREKRLKQESSEQGELGIAKFEKPELSGDPSVMVHEMDSQKECQELSEEKEGQRHELPENSVPQELPDHIDGLFHELPGGGSIHQGIPNSPIMIPRGKMPESEKAEHNKEKWLASGISQETNPLNIV